MYIYNIYILYIYVYVCVYDNAGKVYFLLMISPSVCLALAVSRHLWPCVLVKRPTPSVTVLEGPLATEVSP